MKIVAHRINTSSGLSSTPTSFGVEIDLRSNSSELYLAHDAFEPGESFSNWLISYEHELLVLNVKEEGLENHVTKLLEFHGVTEYFFLDQSLPFLINRGLSGYRDGACRVSDFETMETVRELARFCDWVWVDSFNPNFDRVRVLEELSEMGLKSCLVSPELHNLERLDEAKAMISTLEASGVRPDAVCTKNPAIWQAL